jgi:hypothetical protein
MTVSVQFSLDTNLHHLMCDGPGGLAIAGPRILRGNPPAVSFAHETEEAALKDAEVLNRYFAGLPKVRKTKSRATGAFSE